MKDLPRLVGDLRKALREARSASYPVKVKNPEVSGTFEVYSDASGAPATLSYKGITFAFDYLGEIRSNRIGKVSKESRKFRKVATSVLLAAYKELLKKHTDEAWMKANREMYAT
jgi:hypothetical protein